jgi:hypothetical protein
LKTNFKVSKSNKSDSEVPVKTSDEPINEMTELEFEEFVSKSGAAGSFMVYRSIKKDDELGLDTL